MTQRTRSDIDWAKKPEPWNRIGPAVRVECERIVGETIAQSQGAESRRRRQALGISEEALGAAAGYAVTGAATVVSRLEHGYPKGSNPITRARVEEALERLEQPQGRIR